MNDFGQRGTLRKEREPEPVHWAWSLAGMMLEMLFLSFLAAWLIEVLV